MVPSLNPLAKIDGAGGFNKTESEVGAIARLVVNCAVAAHFAGTAFYLVLIE